MLLADRDYGGSAEQVGKTQAIGVFPAGYGSASLRSSGLRQSAQCGEAVLLAAVAAFLEGVLPVRW